MVLSLRFWMREGLVSLLEGEGPEEVGDGSVEIDAKSLVGDAEVKDCVGEESCGLLF